MVFASEKEEPEQAVPRTESALIDVRVCFYLELSGKRRYYENSKG